MQGQQVQPRAIGGISQPRGWLVPFSQPVSRGGPGVAATPPLTCASHQRARRRSCGCPRMRSCALTRHDALASWGPMCRVLYRSLVSLARLAVRSGRSKDLEVIVLRHQLTVLHRHNDRPALADDDRTMLSAIAARHGQRPETAIRYPRRIRSPVRHPL